MRGYSRKNKDVCSTIQLIPNEVLSEIFARVASSSFTDIFNTKLSCKLFEEIAEDTHVYRHVSLDKFPIVLWKPLNIKQQSFLTKCRHCQNPELFYRQATIYYFTGRRVDVVYKYLERAANSGDFGAMYLRCIVLLFSGDDILIKSGIQLLGLMKKSRSGIRKVRDWRDKMIKILNEIWVTNKDLRRPPICCTTQDDHPRKFSWDDILDEGERVQCEACSADIELKYICNAIPSLI